MRLPWSNCNMRKGQILLLKIVSISRAKVETWVSVVYLYDFSSDHSLVEYGNSWRGKCEFYLRFRSDELE
jgi:hypothetical protein